MASEGKDFSGYENTFSWGGGSAWRIPLDLNREPLCPKNRQRPDIGRLNNQTLSKGTLSWYVSDRVL